LVNVVAARSTPHSAVVTAQELGEDVLKVEKGVEHEIEQDLGISMVQYLASFSQLLIATILKPGVSTPPAAAAAAAAAVVVVAGVGGGCPEG
jgi:hypothetical protein